ncbi:MAG: hypothetical protein ACOXZK_03565 [Bacteroidales bacterium]|nr:hypothetical protein [Bacteroidales bacterium]
MRLFLFSAIASLSILLFSCKSNETADSDKVVQGEIFQSYSVRYNAEKETQTNTANFRFGGTNGTTLRLVNGSNTTWNNEKLKEVNTFFTGTYYEVVKKGKPISENVFEYVDNDKNKFKNIIPLVAAEPIIEKNKISKTENLVVSWTGVPYFNNDNIIISIKDSVKTHYFEPNLVGASDVTITPQELMPIKAGSVNIQIKRIYDNKLDQCSEIGGNGFSEYLSRRVHLIVEE